MWRFLIKKWWGGWTNSAWSHLYMEFKKNKVRTIKQIGGYQGQGIGEMEEIDESAQKVQNSN